MALQPAAGHRLVRAQLLLPVSRPVFTRLLREDLLVQKPIIENRNCVWPIIENRDHVGRHECCHQLRMLV